MLVILLLVCLAQFSVAYQKPSIPPPSLWPQPHSVIYGSQTYTIDIGTFEFSVTSQSTILKKAINRTRAAIQSTTTYLAHLYPAHKVTPADAVVTRLQISVVNDQTPLTFGVDESYTLKIGPKGFPSLSANTVWGALHGLKTFEQFVQWDGKNHIIQRQPSTISDSPKFPWRGMLVDTARHFLSLETLRNTIELLAASKMNVLHWHLTDAEAFTVRLDSHPELAAEGAYDPTATYSKQDIKQVIEYGTLFGVRVVPEIDTPGHTYSWGASHPDLILECANLISRRKDYPGINNVPFDMTKDKLYTLLADVLTEITRTFPDPYIHLGGDEISSGCVREFPFVLQWMKERGMNTSDYSDLVKYYEKKLIDIVSKTGKKMIFWQELFEMFAGKPNNPLPNGTIIHVWINPGSDKLVRDIVTSGYQVLVSSGWYLDQQNPSRYGNSTHYLWLDTWRDFYQNDILANVHDLTQAQQAQVLGGEVCQWAEQVDDDSIITRGWPRAAAAAESLWSRSIEDPDLAFHRLAGHRCRLFQRGFAVSPLRPDFCLRK